MNINRRGLLTGALASIAYNAIAGNAHAQTAAEPTVLDVPYYIDPELSTGSHDPVGILYIAGFDSSGSVTTPNNEFQNQLNTLADTIERPDFRESIFMPGGPGSAALFVADYSNDSLLRIAGIDFREDDPRKFEIVANRIRTLERRANDGTKHHTFLENAARCLDHCPWQCDNINVNIMTDGTGTKNENIKYMKMLAERYGAVVSSLTTRVSAPDIYEWCKANLTTPAYKFTGPDGKLLKGGITEEIATEIDTQSDNVVAYANAVYKVFRKQMILQSASLEPNRTHAMLRARHGRIMGLNQLELT